MSGMYRKRGAVVRWENGVLVRVIESGEASDDGTTFRCAPSAESSLPQLDAARVVETAHAIESLAAGRVTIERLLVSEGAAEHELGEKRWSDRSQRVHLSLVRGTLRVLLDLGTFATGDVEIAVRALAAAEPHEQPAPESLILAPIVSAALLPSVLGNVPAGLELWQSGGGLDGCGDVIEEVRIGGDPPPNWYRPSYRMRPVRFPLNLRAQALDAATGGDARAVALLAPVHGARLRVLVDDGSRMFPATVHVDRVRSIAAAATWYPYAAGSFGAEMVL